MRLPLTSFAEHRQIAITIDVADEVERATLDPIKRLSGATSRASLVTSSPKPPHLGGNRRLRAQPVRKLAAAPALSCGCPSKARPRQEPARMGSSHRSRIGGRAFYFGAEEWLGVAGMLCCMS